MTSNNYMAIPPLIILHTGGGGGLKKGMIKRGGGEGKGDTVGDRGFQEGDGE
jgi:hypothetical protein